MHYVFQWSTPSIFTKANSEIPGEIFILLFVIQKELSGLEAIPVYCPFQKDNG